MEFVYSGPRRTRENIVGVRFKPSPGGPVHIIQHPLWDTGNTKEPGETNEEFESRKKLEDVSYPEKMNNLYVAGLDGIDIGQSQTSELTKNPSKFCTVIKRRVHGMKEPTYVAYYLDRPQEEKEAYTQSIALMYYYNAVGNIEASRLGILGFAKSEKWMQFFMRRPRICSGDPTKKRSTSIPYGTTTSTAMIDHGLKLIASYIDDYYQNIWFPEFLDQFIKYNDANKGKFDIVAACQMAEIADEELSDVIPKPKQQYSDDFEDIGYYKDEYGYTRYGVIPKTNYHLKVNVKWDLYDGKNIITNPNYR